MQAQTQWEMPAPPTSPTPDIVGWVDTLFIKLKPKFVYTKNKNHIYTYFLKMCNEKEEEKLSFAIIIDIKLFYAKNTVQYIYFDNNNICIFFD